MEKLNDKELHIIGHSIGVNVCHCLKSNKKKDKRLPKEFCRNYYFAPPHHPNYPILIDLVKRELIETDDDEYFHVTKKGLKLFKTEFKNYVNTQTTVG